MEAYRLGPGRKLQDALDENRALLKSKKKDANVLAKKMNALLKAMRSGEGEGGRTAELKASYKALHMERTMLLNEAEYHQKLVTQCAREIKMGVEQCMGRAEGTNGSATPTGM